MASKRSYRNALPMENVKAEIEKNQGIMYDPEVARVMLENWNIPSEIYGWK